MLYRAVAGQRRELDPVLERRVIHLYIVRSDAVVEQPVAVSAVDVHNGLRGLDRVIRRQNVVAVDEGQIPLFFVYFSHLRRKARVCVFIFGIASRGGVRGLLGGRLFGLGSGALNFGFRRGDFCGAALGLRLARGSVRDFVVPRAYLENGVCADEGNENYRENNREYRAYILIHFPYLPLRFRQLSAATQIYHNISAVSNTRRNL